MTTSTQRLAALGWSAEFEDDFRPYTEHHRPARIARVDRGGADLIDVVGPARATYGGEILAEAARRRSAFPAVGDWVALRDWSDRNTTLEVILPRRTRLVREAVDRTSDEQVIAANVDLVVVVEHLDPDPDLARVERLLVIARRSHAAVLVVLTKADLVPDVDGMRREVVDVAAGTPVVAVSVTTGAGLDEVREHLAPGRTLALLGPSGAGKSSLVNALAGEVVMPTAEVRESDGRGRHTTTHRQLVVLPGGGVVIDTPGLRAVGLVAESAAVDAAFPEIVALAEGCRDCTHTAEPGCAVRAAVADGELDERRLESWRKLSAEAELNALRADPRRWRQQVTSLRDRQRRSQR